MSVNQSRVEKCDTHNRKSGISSGPGHQRSYQNTSTGKGGASGAGSSFHSSPSSNSSLPVANANRSLKKNDGPGGQSRVTAAATNPEILTNRAVQNDNAPQSQPAVAPLSGASGMASPGDIKHNDNSIEKSGEPLSCPPPTYSSARPPVSASTDAPSGDSSKNYSLQFGTISPGFMNRIEIPARTSSAPPNLDEQKHDQAFHVTRPSPMPTIVAAKQPQYQHQLRKDSGVKLSNVPETHQAFQQRRDAATLQIPVSTQNTTLKPSVFPHVAGSVSVSFQQLQPPAQFNNPNAQNLQSVSAGSVQMPMSLSVGNVAQVQPSVFVHSLQPHPLQAQGVIHQSPGLGCGPQMNPHLGPQLGSLGIGMAPQFPQSAVNKFGTMRKAVKITDPKTREELKLDKRIDSSVDASTSGQAVQFARSQAGVAPQSQQPISSFASAHQIGYYSTMQPSTYTPSMFFPGQAAHPLPNTQVTPGSSAPRYNYPLHHGGPAVPVANHAAQVTSLPPTKPGPVIQPTSEPANLEAVTGQFASVNIKAKPPTVLIPAKVGSFNSALFVHSSFTNTGVLRSEPVKLSGRHEESGSAHFQKPTDGARLISSAMGEILAQLPPTVSSVVPSDTGPGICIQQPKHVSRPPSFPDSLHVKDSVPAGVTGEPRQASMLSSLEHVVISEEPVHALTNIKGGHKWDPLKRSVSLTDQQNLKRKEQRQSELSDQVYDSAGNLTLEMVKNGLKTQESSLAAPDQVPSPTPPFSSSLKLENSSSSEDAVSEVKDCKTLSASVKNSNRELEGEPDSSTGSEHVNAINEVPIISSVGERGPSEPLSSVDPEVIPEGLFSSSSITNEDFPLHDPGTAKQTNKTTRFEESRSPNVTELQGQASINTPVGCSDSSETVDAFLDEVSMVDRADKRVTGVLSNQLEQENISREEVSTSLTSGPVEVVGTEINKEEKEGILGDSPATSQTCSDSRQDEDLSSPHLVLDGYGKCMKRDCFDERSRSAEEHADSDRGLSSGLPSVTSDVVQKHETRGTENRSCVLTSNALSSSKDKMFLDQGKLKNVSGKKKKKRELLSKADAAGATSDLYMAYKAPEEKRGVATSENVETLSSSNDKQMPADETEKLSAARAEDQNRSELDDWEEASEISSPKLKALRKCEQMHSHKSVEDHNGGSVGKKRYTRDFFMTFSEKYKLLPPGFGIGMDIADLVMSAQVNVSARGCGRIHDRQPSGSSRPDCCGSGNMEEDRWNKLTVPFVPGRGDLAYSVPAGGLRPGQGGNIGVSKNPRGHAAGQYVSGILSGPVQSLASPGGLPRPSADSDRWQHAVPVQKGLIPSPHTQSVVMHKAEKKYELGKVSDQEEAKQRQLKAILNKLTPQNFEKLFQQVKEVAIDNVVTLAGVISQIFDKALMEPTFCEMYADFCFHLAGTLPDLMEDNEKITFRRLLLNKCQEEFERGEREQAEADKVGEEGEVKQSEEEREEKRINVRRRMLGNIRLIGELYKKKMLTERIMHECIKKLLGQYQNPDEEDVEALCKLMSTIGAIIDHPVAKDHMDAYFDRIQKLSTNQKLSSRMRFMLRDTIDLRKNKWQQRRKIEGPKKIEEVHRDAAQERQIQAGRASRGSGMSLPRRGQAIDYGPRGSPGLPTPAGQQMGSVRGMPASGRFVAQDIRLEDRHTLESRTTSHTLPQRSRDDDSITLGPQGGLGKMMSMRGQPSASSGSTNDLAMSTRNARKLATGINGSGSAYSGADWISYRSREEVSSRDRLPDRSMSIPVRDQSNHQDHIHGDTINNQSSSPGRHNSSDKLSEERLKEKSMSIIKEFYSANDEEEVASCMKDLNAPNFYPTMVALWVTDSFERKDTERGRLTKLLIFLCKSKNNLLSQLHLVKGFESVFTILPDAIYDAPKAAEFLGGILAKVILENIITLGEVGRLIRGGGEEPGDLTEAGIATDVLCSIFEIIKKEKGENVLNEIRRTSDFRLEYFLHPDPQRQSKLTAFA